MDNKQIKILEVESEFILEIRYERYNNFSFRTHFIKKLHKNLYNPKNGDEPGRLDSLRESFFG